MDICNFINLTPHAITLVVEGVNYVFPPSGQLARVTMTEETVSGPFPAIRRQAGAVELPDMAQFAVDPGDGAELFVPAWLIVSSMVLEAAKAQGHPMVSRMVAPDTGPTAIREGGQVKAVIRFVLA